MMDGGWIVRSWKICGVWSVVWCGVVVVVVGCWVV